MIAPRHRKRDTALHGGLHGLKHSLTGRSRIGKVAGIDDQIGMLGVKHRLHAAGGLLRCRIAGLPVYVGKLNDPEFAVGAEAERSVAGGKACKRQQRKENHKQISFHNAHYYLITGTRLSRPPSL